MSLPERPIEPPDVWGKDDASPDFDQREDDMNYIRDYLIDFVEFAESYIPDIVDEFKEHYSAQYKHWCKCGCVIRMGGHN